MLDEFEFLYSTDALDIARLRDQPYVSMRQLGSEVKYTPEKSATGVWRQLQLARADLDADKLADGRKPARVGAITATA